MSINGALKNGLLFKRIFAVFLSLFLFVSLGSQAAFANSKYAGIVIDARSGKTLYSYKADQKRYPASLTKMMTVYMVFDALERGQISKKTRIKMTETANSKPPSRIAISTGKTLSVDSAIRALVTKSANNVAAAIAEHLGGTESNFAKKMTQRARALGMSSTTFKNASGLTAKGQLTTARDMAKLGLALREHFPQYYSYFSLRSFNYGKYRYGNHNRLLGRVRGVDGIKTGYTRASGYNLVTSVQDRGRKIVAVVIGGRSGASRNAQMQKLIANYLKKGRRTGNKRLIASKATVRANSGIQYASLKLPKKAAAPRFKNDMLLARLQPKNVPAPSIQTAQLPVPAPRGASATGTPLQLSTATQTSPRFRPQDKMLNSREELVAYMNAAAKQNAKPAPHTLEAQAAALKANAFAPEPKAKAADLATASITKRPTGWQIQIGAVPSPENAQKLHNKINKLGLGSLKNKRTWTQEITKGSGTLYRVRFTGFDSKTQARKACNDLEKRKFDCIAINQS